MLKSKFDAVARKSKMIDYGTFYTFNEKARSSVIITAEHAGNLWPEGEDISGMPENWQDQHYAYDRGAREFAIKLARRLNCPVVLGKFSRVLIDLNRVSGAEDIVKRSNDGVDFGMNYIQTDDKKVVPDNLLDRRVSKYYVPYHRKVRELLGKGSDPRKHLCVHSYVQKRLTEQSASGHWELGIQYPNMNPMVRSALDFFRAIKGENIGDNAPYNLRNGLPGAISLHASSFGIDTVELEFRDDQLTDPILVKFWLDKTVEWAKGIGLDHRYKKGMREISYLTATPD